MGTHTPTPWTIEPIGKKLVGANGEKVFLYDFPASFISHKYLEPESNTKLILERVNGWDEQQAKIDELASVLKDAESIIDHENGMYKDSYGMHDAILLRIRKALIRAKG